MKRRYSLVFLAFSAGCTPQRDAMDPSVRPVYEAARSIEASLAVGVPFQEFGSEVREMSQRLLVARDRVRFGVAPPGISGILGEYGKLLEMYRDSETIWHLEIAESTRDSKVAEIVRKYGIPHAMLERKTSYGGTEVFVGWELIRQTIWTRATVIQEAQTSRAYGRFAIEPRGK